MAVFGADQVREYRNKTRYFDYYYAAVNIGGLIAFGAIAYLQLNTNYFIGYLVPGALLAVAFVLFLLGYTCYAHAKPQQSLLLQFLPVLHNAFQSWRIHRRNRHTNASADETSIQENAQITPIATHQSSSSLLDYAKAENGGRYSDSIVNDIKSIRQIIAVFLLLTPYWLLYVQVPGLNAKNLR